MEKSDRAWHWIRDYFAIPVAPLTAGIIARHTYNTHELNAPKVIPDIMFMVAVMTVVTAADLGRIDGSKNSSSQMNAAAIAQALLYFLGFLSTIVYGGYIFNDSRPIPDSVAMDGLVGIVWLLATPSIIVAFVGARIAATSN